MAKKGATQSGGAAGRQKTEDQRRAANLPPSPATWNKHPQDWPYHRNLGTNHKDRVK